MDEKDLINETPENNEPNNDNKKKLSNKQVSAIIIAVIIIVAGIVVAVALSSKSDNNFKDEYVTEIVTDENGEKVTNAAGEYVTEYVTDKSGNKVKANGTTSAENSSTLAGETVLSTTVETTKSNSGSNSEETTKKSDTTTSTTTAKEEKRQIELSVVLPNSKGVKDTLYIYVDGKLVDLNEDDKDEDGASVKLDGSVYTYKTDKVKGDIKIEAKLKKYTSNASTTVKNNIKEATINLPLNSTEGLVGEDL